MDDENNVEIQEAPYGTEYAKSNRSACKGCRDNIGKGELRMAVRFPSKFFDGMQENWHHFECFWKKARKNDINEASIRGMGWLRWEDQQRIRQRIDELKASGGDGYGGSTPKSTTVKVEHAKSSSGKCHICKEKISKDSLRIATKSAFQHIKCFQSSGTFHSSAEEIIGYNELSTDEKAELEQHFPKPQQSEKKRKQQDADSSDVATPIVKREKLEDDEKTKKALKKQSDLIWQTRDQLHDNLNINEMEEILLANRNYKSKKDGREGVLLKLVDLVVFGVPNPCPECGGTLKYSDDLHTYQCTGNISEYTKCLYTTRKPNRTPLKIPKDLKEEKAIFKTLKSPILKERLYPIAAINEEVLAGGSKAFRSLNPVKSAKKSSSSGAQKYVVKGGNAVDPKCTVATLTHVYVDPITKRPWQANLSAMDISTGRNSFYKLQIVKDDNHPNYYLFRSWGRIGTNIGGTKTEEFETDLESCQQEFKKLFNEKTHNEWEDFIHGNFKKRTHGMDILELDFSDEKYDKKVQQKLEVESSKSKLPRELKELIAMVFDMDTLKSTMKEFEIDMEKMPLGRLSRAHILKAYQVLTDLQLVLEEQDREQKPPKSKFIDFTNRFYTNIPHATGLKSPPLLDNLNILKLKTEMLDNLLEIEIACNILKSEEGIDGKDAFDMHYEKLKCKMEIVDRKTNEFSLIKRYVENTHASTHDITLEIVNVIKIDRQDEMNRFKKEIGNRHLLWHGSRLSNYAGILSQGLRIAPPEAPVTGYMFGKGIYLADMVTKSANYCYTLTGEGLLLLCDAALGEIQEEKDAKDIKKPKRGKNSIKGVGDTLPNPREAEELDGMIVPCGKPIKSDAKDLSLLYNEYIVYDEAQVRLRYIVRVKFDSNLL